MTDAARNALEDCRGAIDSLVDGVQGREWRRRWILSVVLLRAIGHVLDKVDGARSRAHRAEIDGWWSNLKISKPLPTIFWEFIDEERNSILKQYRTNAGHGVTVQLSGIEVSTCGEPPKVDPPNPAIYHYVLNGGPYQGCDHRDVLRDALEWWEQQLDQIDQAVAGRGP